MWAKLAQMLAKHPWGWGQRHRNDGRRVLLETGEFDADTVEL